MPIGLLRARSALVFNTSNTPAEREQTAFHDPLETLWKNCIFDLCGVKVFFRRTFSVVVTSREEHREDEATRGLSLGYKAECQASKCPIVGPIRETKSRLPADDGLRKRLLCGYT